VQTKNQKCKQQNELSPSPSKTSIPEVNSKYLTQEQDAVNNVQEQVAKMYKYASNVKDKDKLLKSFKWVLECSSNCKNHALSAKVKAKSLNKTIAVLCAKARRY
jgi:hypothetical protein